MNEILISPSDLSYFWSSSKIGFYDKYILQIQRPKQAFPSVFNTIDLKMKDAFDKKPIDKIVHDSPIGVISHDEIYVKSKFFKLGNYKVGFKGKLDCLLDHGDGTYSVVDYKTTHFSDKLKDIYYLQLMAYAYCLENPETGEPKTIRNLGLIVFEPSSFHYTFKNGSLKGGLHWVTIPYDKDKFKKWLIKELKPLLNTEREKLFASSSDLSWKKYVECFYLEESEEEIVK